MTLAELFTNIANAIRGKDGTTTTIAPTDFPSRITAIETSQTPDISISSSGLITATSGNKSSTKQLTTQDAKTVTPGTSSQTAVNSGIYTTGAITVSGDSNLIASNIKSGVSIFGVDGSLENIEYFCASTFTSKSLSSKILTITLTGSNVDCSAYPNLVLAAFYPSSISSSYSDGDIVGIEIYKEDGEYKAYVREYGTSSSTIYRESKGTLSLDLPTISISGVSSTVTSSNWKAVLVLTT